MTTFTIHTAESAPEPARAPLAELERRIGFIPNLAATMAGSPAAIAGFGGLQGALRGADLSAAEREVIGITVSRENDCEYSLAAHAAFARNAGAGEETVAALLAGEPVAGERDRALQALTQALLRERGHVETDLPAELVLETIAQVAYTTFANLVANVARTPVDGAFAAV